MRIGTPLLSLRPTLSRWSLVPFGAAAVAGVATYRTGPSILLLLSAGAIAAAALVSQIRWTLLGLVVANLMAVSKASLLGSSLSLATVGTPARNVALAILGAQLARQLIVHGLPLRAVIHLLPLLAAVGLSLLAAPAVPVDGVKAPGFCLLIVGLAVLAWRVQVSDRSLRAVIFALAFAYGALVAANLVLLPFINQPASGPLQSPAVRFQGILENPNTVGSTSYVAVAALVGAAMLRPPASLSRRLALILAAVATGEVVLAVSRGGMAALIVTAFTLFLCLTTRKPTTRLLTITFVAAVVSVTLLLGLGTSVSDNLRLNTAAAASGRTSTATLVIKSIGQQPLFGHGYGSEKQILRSFQDISGGIAVAGGQEYIGLYSGNVFLDCGLELGVIGLGSLLAAFAVPLIQLTRFWRRPLSTTQQLSRAVFLAMALGGLTSVQSESYGLVLGGVSVTALWFSLGMCAASGRPMSRAIPKSCGCG